MCEILIFGGTTEGRLLAEFCEENNISVYISVVSEYGADLLPQSDNVKILKGRKNGDEMEEFISENQIKKVIDATHPYAVEVTENIISACEKSNAEYIRVKRTNENISEYGRYFSDIDSLIDYLNTTDGSIFITTGSKELRSFCRLENFRERCTVRILPNENIITECVDMGFDRAKIIAEKGAFTESRNILHLQKSGSEFLVTKDSGKVGGFDEKISAAKKCGVEVLIIMRPTEDGISLNAAKEILLSEKNHE